VGDESPKSDAEAAPKRRWHGAFTWSSLILAGVLIYELTNQPAIGTAALCSKFGWDDFKTAQWLWRYDPRRARGRACWWLYVASGLSKIGVRAFLVNVAVMVLFGCAGVARERTDAHLRGGGFVFCAGFLLSTVATFMAVCLAARNGIRLWLDSSVSRGRSKGFWPPYDVVYNSFNHIDSLQITVCFMIGLLLLPVCSYPFAMLVPLQGMTAVLCASVLYVVTLGVFVFFWLRFSKLVAATHPSQCWPRVEQEDFIETEPE
jgi:hypothetical protein